jgi:hypothetical protein
MICRVEAMSQHSTVAPGASINPVANTLHHVFGYGSLAAEHLRCPVVRLRGWRRVWGVAMDNSVDVPGYKSYRLRADGSRPAVFVAFVDIELDPAGCVTGVCMPASDLAVLDERERNYDRIDVTAHVEGAPTGRIWAYRGSDAGRARLRDGLAAGRAVVSRDYLDDVLAGLATIAPDEVARARPGGLAVLDLQRLEIARV